MVAGRVPVGWKPEEINPFTGQRYDDTWMVYFLTDTAKFNLMAGGQQVYSLSVSRQMAHWEFSLGDCIDYCRMGKRNCILSVTDQDMTRMSGIYAGHGCRETRLRSEEPHVLVHSTTSAGWESICRDSCVQSWNRLRSSKPDWEPDPIGRLLHDPDDLRDMVMLSDPLASSSEIVVASRQAGELCMDTDKPYHPGARLYFDAKALARDGLLLRDGCHRMVENELSLAPYLLWAATWKDVGLDAPRSTPSQFTALANAKFQSLFGKF